MQGPLSSVLELSHPLEMTLSVLVGMGFGFALERGGFGRADNLAAQFYGRDMRVLRVMFSAIVTAMVGLYLLDLVGILPLFSIGIMDTFLGGQIAGGLLLGAGFIIGGYCPGTSIVAAVSGKIDALLFVGGIALGSGVYTLTGTSMAPLADSGAKGRVLLHEWLHLPSGVVVFAIAVAAVGAFALAGKIESRVRARPAADRGAASAVPARAAAQQERSLP
jgi:uncharacterized protein